MNAAHTGELPGARNRPETLRLFIAVELPAAVRDALSQAMRALQDAGVNEGLRWVRPEGVHITLKFLGPTPAAKVEHITAGLHRAVAGSTPFTLQPAGFGAFHGGRNRHFTRQHPRESYRDNIRVLWVGVHGDTDTLASLARRVEEEIAPLGFPTEKRTFAAHLTLARVRDDATRETRIALSEALQPFLSESAARFDPDRVPQFPAFRVDHISLMQSILRPGGALYRALHTVQLNDAVR